MSKNEFEKTDLERLDLSEDFIKSIQSGSSLGSEYKEFYDNAIVQLGKLPKKISDLTFAEKENLALVRAVMQRKHGWLLIKIKDGRIMSRVPQFTFEEKINGELDKLNH